MRVALFATCLVDTMLPGIGAAAVRLLRRAGVEVTFPEGQTCCGQPAFNAGFWDEARAVAARNLDVFEDAEAVVALSGSCTTMMRVFNRDVLEDDRELQERAARVAAKTYELSEFLVDVLGRTEFGAEVGARVAYHDGCHALRGLQIYDAPRRLLHAVRGLDVVELEGNTRGGGGACASGGNKCCGFGGAFSIDMPAISTAMLEDKLQAIAAAKVDYIVSSDAGCLMQIGGGLRRAGSKTRAIHVAELIAGGLGDEP